MDTRRSVSGIFLREAAMRIRAEQPESGAAYSINLVGERAMDFDAVCK